MSGMPTIADLDAERALLGELLSRPEQLADAMDVLDPADFFGVANRTTYAAILDVDASGESIDLVSVMRRIRQLGRDSEISSSDLVEFTNAPAIASVSEVAKVVRSKARHRRMLSGLERLVATGRDGRVDSDEWIEQVEQVVFELAASDDPSPTIEFSELIDQSLSTVRDRGAGATDYIPTALATVNRYVHGWEPGLPHIVSARPGLGKTAFALQELRNVAGRGFGAVMFSLEMPKLKLSIRMLSQEARVDNAKLMTGKLEGNDWADMGEAAEALGKLPISIVDDGSMTVAKLRAKFRREVIRLRRKHGDDLKVKLVIVDYIQLMSGSGANRDQEIGSVSRDLRAFAKEFNVALIELSQNNREGAKKNDRPQLTDLRESGSLEQDAAKVLFLYNPTANKPPDQQEAKRIVIVAKNRDGGGTGDAWCKFDGPTTRFFVPAHESHEWLDGVSEGLPPPTHWSDDDFGE